VNFKIAALSLGLTLSFSAVAEGATEPKYDCTATETRDHLFSVAHALFAPSTIPEPEEFEKSYIQKKIEEAAAGDDKSQSCVTIFTDPKLDNDWKEAVSDVRNLPSQFSFTSIDAAVIEAAFNKLKDKAREAVSKTLQSLGEDICNALSTDNLKEIALDAANKKYGTSAKSLRISAFASEMREDALDDADDNIKMLLSDKELEKKMDSEAKTEIKKLRKKLWQNF
jgi:hypothetical protein|tara:strand:- start:620 stop:1294 length:675 start_codon:yes stop_codon:yes gene_type:complete